MRHAPIHVKSVSFVSFDPTTETGQFGSKIAPKEPLRGLNGGGSRPRYTATRGAVSRAMREHRIQDKIRSCYNLYMKNNRSITVIGGGLAGLSLGVALADAGFRVNILEKNAYLGGRASNTIDQKTKDPVPIGPHIFVKGYEHFHSFLKKIGAGEAIVWERKFFLELIYNGKHFQFRMSDLPTSLLTIHRILRYPFVNTKDKLSNLRFALRTLLARREKLEKLDDLSAHDYLLSCGVSKNSIDRMWRFFVLSMLNVPIELCSAAELCFLIRYWSGLKNKHIGFAKVGLGDIYAKKASDYITSRGGTINRNTTVTKIAFDGNSVDHLVIESGDGSRVKLKSDIYVSALNPVQLKALLPGNILSSDFFKPLDAFEGVPYISVNIWFDKKLTHKKFWAVLDDATPRHYLNTDFYDLSNIYATRRGSSYVASNIIYSKEFDGLNDGEIVHKTLEELREMFPRAETKMVHSHVHRVPYVIYAPRPGMRKYKLPYQTPISNLYLCGDWTNKHMTQCMEAAVQSGFECAKTINS